jgi:hypothetical protein
MDEGQELQRTLLKDGEDSMKQADKTGTSQTVRPDPEEMDESEELEDEELNGEDESPFDDDEELEDDADGSPTR